MSKPGHALPDALGDLPTLQQVAAAPPRRTPQTTRAQLRRCGIETRTCEGYPKKRHSVTSHISRLEWEAAEGLATRTVTNGLRDKGLDPQPPS